MLSGHSIKPTDSLISYFVYILIMCSLASLLDVVQVNRSGFFSELFNVFDQADNCLRVFVLDNVIYVIDGYYLRLCGGL